MEEPSVLDYIKSLLHLGKDVALEQPEETLESKKEMPSPQEPETHKQGNSLLYLLWGFRPLIPLILALAAQRLLEPPDRHVEAAIILYILAGIAVTWLILSNQWQSTSIPEDVETPFSLRVRRIPLLLTLPLLIITFFSFGGNKFTIFNVILFAATIFYLFWSLWIPGSRKSFSGLIQPIKNFFKNPEIHIRISPWILLVMLVCAVIIFFRFYRLDQVPGEMFSDHAEKLLDVADILDGKTSIFFPRNTGREAIQFYLTAAISVLFGTGLSFISLKIGTALIGLFTLPFIYLFGKEAGNRWIGLIAMLMAGVAYWPNLISRIGLRFPLYPLFAAPVLFFLVRGLRTSNRNDFLWAGLALGLGLHGYSPFRFVPVVVLVGIGLYLIHKQSKGKRLQAIWGLTILAIIALVIFLPLMRYALEDPQMFGYRTLTRLGSSERPLPGPIGLLFLKNLWSAITMFFWSNGDIWVHSVTGRPALDIVGAALFFMGVMTVFLRYLKRRNWLDLFLLISVPLLMMPSILSLAFPGENPSLNRTGGAIIPVFIIIAIALEGVLSSLIYTLRVRWKTTFAVMVGVFLVLWSASQSYTLVFEKFDHQFMAGAWNTSQIGKAIRSFAESFGSYDTAYVVPFPHWVDTRLVGITAGVPRKDYAINQDQLKTTLNEPRNKFFIFKSDDKTTLMALQYLYPDGALSIRKNPYEGKDFFTFWVPGQP